MQIWPPKMGGVWVLFFASISLSGGLLCVLYAFWCNSTFLFLSGCSGSFSAARFGLVLVVWFIGYGSGAEPLRWLCGFLAWVGIGRAGFRRCVKASTSPPAFGGGAFWQAKTIRRKMQKSQISASVGIGSAGHRQGKIAHNTGHREILNNQGWQRGASPKGSGRLAKQKRPKKHKSNPHPHKKNQDACAQTPLKNAQLFLWHFIHHAKAWEKLCQCKNGGGAILRIAHLVTSPKHFFFFFGLLRSPYLQKKKKCLGSQKCASSLRQPLHRFAVLRLASIRQPIFAFSRSVIASQQPPHFYIDKVFQFSF
jgi:hypothetical protein